MMPVFPGLSLTGEVVLVVPTVAKPNEGGCYAEARRLRGLPLPASMRSRTDILRGTAALAVNDPLQAPMFSADAEELPDLKTALDEVLAVRVVVDHEPDDFIGQIAVAVPCGVTPTGPVCRSI
jgi:hypothetical protein